MEPNQLPKTSLRLNPNMLQPGQESMHAKAQESVTCNVYTSVSYLFHSWPPLAQRTAISPVPKTTRLDVKKLWQPNQQMTKNTKKLLRRPSSCVPDIFLISEPLTEAWIIAKFSSFLAPPDSVTPQGRLRYWWVSSGQLPKYVGQAFEARSWRWIRKCWDFEWLCQLRQGLEENSNFIWNKMSFCFSKSSEPHEWVPKWRMCIVCSSCQTDTKQCSDKRMEKATSIQPLYRNLKCWKWKIRTTVQVSTSKYLQKLPSGIAEDISQDIPAWYIAAPDFT